MTERAPTIVVGAGIAGLAAVRALLDTDVPTLLVSESAAEHAKSAARRDGIDAAIDDDDSVETHAADLARIGKNQADPAALVALTEAAREITDDLEKLGVFFERGRNGRLSPVKLAGSSVARTLHASSLTARYVSRRLGARLDASELQRMEGWRFVDLVLDDDRLAVGVIVESKRTGETRALRADGICLATGGYEGLFHDQLGAARLGGALGTAVQRGARLVHLDRVQVSELGYDAGGIARQFPERLLALGARIDDGKLDLGDVPRDKLRAAAGPALDAFTKTTGRDPRAKPIPVFRIPDRSLGGLEIDRDHATSVAGLFAVGSAACAYHGAAAASGSGLLVALFGAKRAAAAIVSYRDALQKSAEELPDSIFDGSIDLAPSDDPYAIEMALRERMRRAFAGDREGLSADLDELAARGARASEIALARAWAAS